MTIEFVGWALVGLIFAMALNQWFITKKLIEIQATVQDNAVQPQEPCKFPDIGTMQDALKKANDAELEHHKEVMGALHDTRKTSQGVAAMLVPIGNEFKNINAILTDVRAQSAKFVNIHWSVDDILHRVKKMELGPGEVDPVATLIAQVASLEVEVSMVRLELEKQAAPVVGRKHRLTSEQQADIKARYIPGVQGRKGTGNTRQLAQEFGVSETLIRTTMRKLGEQE